MTPVLNYLIALLLLIGLGTFLLIQHGGSALDWLQRSGETVQIYVKGVPFTVTVADTPEQRRQGLSGTPQLDPYTGKLFIFDEPKKYGIWMKDMNYPIDIMWFSEDETLVHYEENVRPDTYPDVFAPPAPALYVVEVPSGTVNDLQVNVGDSLELPAYLE